MRGYSVGKQAQTGRLVCGDGDPVGGNQSDHKEGNWDAIDGDVDGLVSTDDGIGVLEVR